MPKTYDFSLGAVTVVTVAVTELEWDVTTEDDDGALSADEVDARLKAHGLPGEATVLLPGGNLEFQDEDEMIDVITDKLSDGTGFCILNIQAHKQ